MRKEMLVTTAIAVLAFGIAPALAQKPQRVIHKPRLAQTTHVMPAVRSTARVEGIERIEPMGQVGASPAYIHEYTSQWRLVDPTSSGFGPGGSEY